MKCCELYAGMLRVKVQVQERQSVPDGAGGSAVTWVTVLEPYTAWKHATMRERLQAMQMQATVMHRVWLRYTPTIRPDMRIVDADGATYNIRGVTDIEKRRDWLELAVEENAPS